MMKRNRITNALLSVLVSRGSPTPGRFHDQCAKEEEPVECGGQWRAQNTCFDFQFGAQLAYL